MKEKFDETVGFVKRTAEVFIIHCKRYKNKDISRKELIEFLKQEKESLDFFIRSLSREL